MRKRWIAGFVALLAIFVFAGCEGPRGPAGPPGLGDITDGPRVIVVGAGIGGMIAALSAADALVETGGGQVILLEADDIVGGSFVIAGGGWNAPVGNWNFNDDATDFSWGEVQIRRGGANAANFVNSTGAIWLPEYDASYRLWTRVMAFASPMRQGAFSPMRWNIPISGNAAAVTGGNTYQDSSGLLRPPPGGPGGSRSMELAVQRHPNISLVLASRAVELTATETGYAVRTEATQTFGWNTTFYGDAVILATGGHSQSAEQLHRFRDDILVPALIPYVDGLPSLALQGWVNSGAAPFHLGDGIDMALDVGGSVMPRMYGGAGGNLNFSRHLRVLPEFPNNYRSVLYRPLWTAWAGLQFRNFIIVNRDGDRFMSESLNHHPSGGGGGAGLWNNRRPPYYVIVPVNTAAAPWLTEAGNLRIPGVNIHNALIAASNLGGVAANEVQRADTLADLAEAMELYNDAARANFLDTLLDYNTRVAAAIAGISALPETGPAGTVTRASTGVNSAFDSTDDDGQGKAANDMLVHIQDGADMEFFAIRVYAGPFSNMGGVRVDWRGRLLDEDRQQVGNMVYAVGELTFRNFYNGSYPGGSALVVSPTQGYIAGRDAVYRLRGLPGIPSRIAGDDGN